MNNSKLITFQKSYEKRLEDYRIILNRYSSPVIRPSEIAACWSIYLEFNLKPKGWNALWYVLRKCCDDLQVEFPQVVPVLVNDIDFQLLTADVTIVPTGDDDFPKLPNRVQNAPLKDLYVTVDQENPEINAVDTAECLDQLRLFYHQLWRPWDADFEEYDYDWVVNHLEERLELYYYKLQGNVHYVSGKIIKHLIERGNEIHEKINDYSESLVTLRDTPLPCCRDSFNTIIDLYDELDRIQYDLKPWEISELRTSENEKIKKKFDNPGVLLVVDGLVEDLEASLSQTLGELSREGIIKKITNSFEESLLYYNRNDTILVGPGNYQINTREFFDFNVTIEGLLERKTLISDFRSHWCLLESVASEVNIANISFDLNFCQSVIKIKRGTVRLKSVIMENFKNGASGAVHVYKNAKLIADQCHFSGFEIAIFCTNGSSIELTDCTFENNNIGLKILKGAYVSMNNCDLKMTTDVPIQYESEEPVDGDVFVSLDDLKTSDECVSFNSVSVADGAKCVQIL